MKRFASAPRFLVTLGLCLFSAFAPSAHATLLPSPTVTLDSPLGFVGGPFNPINFFDTTTLVAGAEIKAGDTTNIGGQMLPGEFIDFHDDINHVGAITLKIACGTTVVSEGASVCVTGFGSGAKYVFGELDDTLGTIIGISLSDVSGFLNASSVIASWVTLDDPNTISLALDTMQFIDIGGDSGNFGLLTINLILGTVVQPPNNDVPEPNSLALALLAGLVLAGFNRQRKA
jgi:hypothetical protein